MTVPRLTRNLAVFLWGSETLKERSVTGADCRRFKKNGIEAKRALTLIKVDAVQSEFSLKLAYFKYIWKDLKSPQCQHNMRFSFHKNIELIFIFLH
ncbi:hypothetical protein AVEN_240459-1 [Araneus ventricosus]|uniref:Uncharacterized protein n=1 Tax=Araneus ventricosus TaxID=182803 RepID=A0A4Y2QQ63_ARAVE|nr:hypothetical protein AVEN_240459-1 [Araneus ventricosus]